MFDAKHHYKHQIKDDLMPEILCKINPDRNTPWNDLPLLPIKKELHQTLEIVEKLGDAKGHRNDR